MHFVPRRLSFNAEPTRLDATDLEPSISPSQRMESASTSSENSVPLFLFLEEVDIRYTMSADVGRTKHLSWWVLKYRTNSLKRCTTHGLGTTTHCTLRSLGKSRTRTLPSLCSGLQRASDPSFGTCRAPLACKCRRFLRTSLVGWRTKRGNRRSMWKKRAL